MRYRQIGKFTGLKKDIPTNKDYRFGYKCTLTGIDKGVYREDWYGKKHYTVCKATPKVWNKSGTLKVSVYIHYRITKRKLQALVRKGTIKLTRPELVK